MDTCLFRVICMLFLAVIISKVLHGVLKQGPILETHVIFHVFMCNLISLYANRIVTPSTVLLFAELQSYSFCQALFSSSKER